MLILLYLFSINSEIRHTYRHDVRTHVESHTEINRNKEFPTIFFSKKTERKTNKLKFRIGLGLEKIFFLSPYDSTVSFWELPKIGTSFGIKCDYFLSRNLSITFDASYMHRLQLRLHQYHPMDRTWYLRFISISGIIHYRIYHPFGLPLDPYLGLGIGFYKASNITDFFSGNYYIRNLPIASGIQYKGGINYELLSSFSIDVNFGIQQIIIKDIEKEVYNLSGLSLGIKIEYNL